MQTQPIVEFASYAALGIAAFLLWWVVYEHVLTRGFSTRDAIFGRAPNMAVALDVAGGFAAMGLLTHGVISGPAQATFARDVEALALELLGTLVLLALLRMAIAAGLRAWFGGRRDAQGDLITLNNELFRQRNLATGFFSTGLYGILVAGLLELDLLNVTGAQGASAVNMLGAWAVGALAVLLHSWLYLGLGGRHNILAESFHHNNPAAATSLLGLLAGVLLLNHQLLPPLEQGAHIFAAPAHWGLLALGVGGVLVLRAVLGWLLRGLLGVNLRAEMLERHNPAWGVLDGAVIFALLLNLGALIA